MKTTRFLQLLHQPGTDRGEGISSETRKEEDLPEIPAQHFSLRTHGLLETLRDRSQLKGATQSSMHVTAGGKK